MTKTGQQEYGLLASLWGWKPSIDKPRRTLLGSHANSRLKLIVGWVPIFWEVQGKSIGGDLDVDDEGSKQR
jgi:hypothetical protein